MCNTTLPNGGIITGFNPNVTTGKIQGEPVVVGNGLVKEAQPLTFTVEAIVQRKLIKKALALLAEQKQSEIKEIEELIKKL